jgi:hypothetical protein
VGPAVAAPYGPHTGAAAVSRTKAVQGQSVTVSGDGFCADSVVSVTVAKGSHVLARASVTASHTGAASSSVTLTTLGRTTLTLRGCFQPGVRDQVLTASVVVVPHSGAAQVSEDRVAKGDRVRVSANGFCRRATVRVNVADDGRGYQTKRIRANRSGAATTTIALTRVGRSTITLAGCRKGGGTLVKTVSVRVAKGSSLRASTAAYAGDVAGRVSPVGFAAVAGVLALFGAAQLTFVRRRRSS